MTLRICIALVATLGMTIQVAAEDFTGPKKGKGSRNITAGEFDMGPEIAGMEGRFMRARYWEIMPGGIVPIHSHANRPGLIYIVQGEIVEHRSDQPEPKLHRAGDVSLENAGLRHWWENESDKIVILIGYDIYKK